VATGVGSSPGTFGSSTKRRRGFWVWLGLDCGDSAAIFLGPWRDGPDLVGLFLPELLRAAGRAIFIFLIAAMVPPGSNGKTEPTDPLFRLSTRPALGFLYFGGSLSYNYANFQGLIVALT
jgi:hypothetical protein